MTHCGCRVHFKESNLKDKKCNTMQFVFCSSFQATTSPVPLQTYGYSLKDTFPFPQKQNKKNP